jgi:hypothetical protein
MISFRLSEQEYESLLTLCSSRGARSLSDLARDTMQALLHDGQADGPANLVQHFRKRMDDLDLEVKRLAQLLAEQKAAKAVGSY